jgi:hypothetical protein
LNWWIALGAPAADGSMAYSMALRRSHLTTFTCPLSLLAQTRN